jgi:hypothetical protein
MKVYLDDERATPNGWTRAYRPNEAIKLVETGDVDESSLDHERDSQRQPGEFHLLDWQQCAPSSRSRMLGDYFGNLWSQSTTQRTACSAVS